MHKFVYFKSQNIVKINSIFFKFKNKDVHYSFLLESKKKNKSAQKDNLMHIKVKINVKLIIY